MSTFMFVIYLGHAPARGRLDKYTLKDAIVYTIEYTFAHNFTIFNMEINCSILE